MFNHSGQRRTLEKKVIAKKETEKKGLNEKFQNWKKKGKGYIIIMNHIIFKNYDKASGACILSLVFLFSWYFWILSILSKYDNILFYFFYQFAWLAVVQ